MPLQAKLVERERAGLARRDKKGAYATEEDHQMLVRLRQLEKAVEMDEGERKVGFGGCEGEEGERAGSCGGGEELCCIRIIIVTGSESYAC